MLTSLKQFGIDKNYFEIKKIGDFSNASKEGFDHIKTEAIDFDKTKEKVCNELKQEGYKSCDALDIIDSKNRINFIEFKQLENRENIIDWIENLDLPLKIKDSRDILYNIVRSRDFVYRDKKKKILSCEKNIIISFSLSNKNSIIKFVSLLRLAYVEEKIISHIKQNYIEGEQFNAPICMKIEDFDKKYLQYK